MNPRPILFLPVSLMILIPSFSSNSVESTGPDSTATWLRVFSGPEYGAFLDMVLTADDHALVVGATNHRHMPPYSGNALFMKIDLEGDVVWERTWGGDGYEQAWSIIPARDGNYYVLGETDSYGVGDRDLFLLKLTPDGEELWFFTYGTPRREWPFGMLPLADGNLLLYGRTESSSGGEDVYALCVTREGTVVWEYREMTSSDELILDALETEAGEIILCNAIVGEDAVLTALDASGRLLRSHRLALPGWQFASTIAAAGDGGCLLAGFAMSGSNSQQQADVWTAEVDASGQIRWQKTFGEPEYDDYAQKLSKLSDGNYLIGGLGRGMPLFKVDRAGNVLWERRLDEMSVYAARAIIELDNGGLLIAGLKEIIGGQEYDAVMMKTDAQGRIYRSEGAGSTALLP